LSWSALWAWQRHGRRGGVARSACRAGRCELLFFAAAPSAPLINRIASLNCAFDGFEDGPGKEFVERLRSLVLDIIDGDFDQVDLYASKLERFHANQATSSDQQAGTIAVLQTKESDLRGALSAVARPEFLRDFTCQVWGQALVPANRQHRPQSELTQRLQHAHFDAPLPPANVEQRFSPEEAKQVGLLEDRAVDWSGHVGIDLSEEPAPARLEPLNLRVDIDLDLVVADPAEPSSGASLIDHHIGFAYQMLLQERWQKVRLTYVSPGRSFFVFTHGRNLQETVSLTARTLLRICKAQRLRAVESSHLLERAASRTRKPLAELVTTMH
jgi:hypothetical protein